MGKFKLLIYFLLFIGIGTIKAQESVLFSFDSTDGQDPCGRLVASRNMLYGTAIEGGAYGYGDIFSIHKDGSGFKDLFDFRRSNGAYVQGSLILFGKTLYGLASGGGIQGYGVIFSIDTDGTRYKVLHNFGSGTDGKTPIGTLTISVTGDTLYGFTLYGGTSSYGTIFYMDSIGTGYTKILDFNGANGAYPSTGALALSGKILYGTTSQGGNGTSYGNVFSVHIDGTGFKDLHDFAGTTNSGGPAGSVILSGNTLYGMTYSCGTNSLGNVFSVDTDGTNYKDLLDFNDANGQEPGGDLIISGGVLYGMTSGVNVNTGYGASYGTIFSIDTNGTEFNKLYTFQGPPDAALPFWNSLTLSGNVFYGVTCRGGIYDPSNFGGGTIFSYTVVGLGIDDVTPEAEKINVYPNPNTGQFTLSGLQKGMILEMYDYTGKGISTSTITNQTMQLNINQADGVYLIRILDKDGNLVSDKKVVKMQ